MNIGGGAGVVLGSTSGIQNLATSLAARLGGSTGDYFEQLRPASWRNVPFVSLGSEGEFGRRIAKHEYPKRDEPWIEDLGRGTRQYRVFGFLVGDDVIVQRDALIAAAEIGFSGVLMHPTYGRRQVSIDRIRCSEHWERGRYIEFVAEFIESGARTYPTISDAGTSLIGAAVTALGGAAALDFAKSALQSIAYGAAVLGAAVSTAVGWYSQAIGFVGDARNLFRTLTNLPGDFGRFNGSATVPTFSKYPSSSFGTAGITTASLTVAATVARANVASAAATLDAAARSLDASSLDAFSAAAQAVPASILAATPDPTDSIRLLSSLSAYTPSAQTTTSAIGSAMASMQTASASLFRRACIASVATAASTYQPASSNDAATVRDQVLTLINAEIRTTGNSGEDTTYQALCTLREAIVTDLDRRGASLPSIRTFNFPAPLPALVLANRIYRDATRADELTSQVNPVHPAFCPTTFKALSS